MTEQKDNTPQEIDLIQLFTNIGNWIGKKFQWIFNIIVSTFYFFLRNTLKFTVVILLGIMIGFGVHYIIRSYYKAQLIGYSHTIDNVEVINSLNNWNYSLEFSEEELENIKEIGASYLLDINGDGLWDQIEELENIEEMDTAIMSQRVYGNFSIVAQVYDTSLIAEIRTKALNYLSSNKRVQERNIIRLRQLEEILPTLNKEITELDSLKKFEYFEKNKPLQAKMGEMLFMGQQETKLYHEQVLALYKQKRDIEREIFLTQEPFEIILDFSVPEKEENDLIYVLKRSLIISFILGLIVIFLIDQKAFVLDQIKKSKKN